MEMQHNFTPQSAAPDGPDPREADRLVCEMVLALGRDDIFSAAGHWARAFVRHAVVVALAFAIVAKLQGWG